MDIPFQTTFLAGPRELWTFVHHEKPPNHFRLARKMGIRRIVMRAEGTSFEKNLLKTISEEICINLACAL